MNPGMVNHMRAPRWMLIAGVSLLALAADGATPPHPVANPESSLMLDLPDTGTDSSEIDFSRLPHIPSKHIVLSDVRNYGGKRVHQHAYLARYGGLYWAMWSDGPGKPKRNLKPEQHINVVPGHDQPDTRVSYAVSEDGVNWSEPSNLSGPPRINGFGWIARGLWVRDGELLGLARHSINGKPFP